MYKLKHSEASGSYICFQRSFLNRWSSHLSHIKAGVLQSSSLQLLFFLVYINDLPEGIRQSYFTFLSVAHGPKITISLHEHLPKIPNTSMGLSMEDVVKLPQGKLNKFCSLVKKQYS